MKIIKEGIDPKKRTYRIECHICKTEFEFEQQEAKYNSDQRDGDFLSINCPICKTNCTIDVRCFVGHQKFDTGNTTYER